MNTLCVVALLGLVALATASDMAYNGKYGGNCVEDGLYYKDTQSFVLCSGGQASEQKCAPGSANSDYSSYEKGQEYNRNHFCTLNLVGQPYASKPYGYGVKDNAYNVKGYGKQQGYPGYNGFYPYAAGGYPYFYGYPYSGYPFPYYSPYAYHGNYYGAGAAPYLKTDTKNVAE